MEHSGGLQVLNNIQKDPGASILSVAPSLEMQSAETSYLTINFETKEIQVGE
jgi:hypothetical protein